MIRNYLKIAWRNIWKNKTFSLINIMGLALGMACSLMIMLWVQNELSMDKFHKNDTRLYRFMENQHYTGQIQTFTATPGILAENIVKDIPEIEMASQILWEESHLFKVGNTFDKENGRFVQGDFLSMFSFNLQKGDAKTALKRPDGVVISQKIANKYFKNQDPIGRSIRIDNKIDVMVTGVLDEIPATSTLTFDYLMSWEVWFKDNQWANQWQSNGPRCMALLAADADIDKVNAKIKDYIKTKNPESNVDLFLQKNSDAYLYGNFSNGVLDGGRIEYTKIFSVVAIFILVIACINFMNLATARSIKRAKEIGIRKVVGAVRGSLIGQFLGESLLIACFGIILAILIVSLLLPIFNDLTQKKLQIDFSNPSFWIVILSLTLITGLVSGSYPALFMSSLNPITVLKGSLKFKPSAAYFRKGLVIFQFGLSIMLILGMIVIYRQINFIHNKHLGFQKEGLIYTPLEGDLLNNFQSFKQELINLPGIKYVSCTQSDPLQNGSSTGGFKWAGKDTTKTILFAVNRVSFDYIKTMGIKMVAGREFEERYSTDTTNFLINQTTAQKMGFKDPIGQIIEGNGVRGKIVGVMKDYHIASLYAPIEPIILSMQPRNENWGSVIVRAEAGQTEQAIVSLKSAFKKFNPNFPFEYRFTDQELNAQYRSEQSISTLANYFAFLAIFISCLGLFGLASFTAEQRTKEIGIRKVLGASVINLVGMLSKDFIILVIIASVVGFPLAYYFMNDWLQQYAYKIEIEWWYFGLALVLALIIALLTVSYQAIRASLMNPVKSLKTE
ncbi:MAG: ABC transporter permease [Spirosomaceae bacterium]|nr:ABC transporter permease [Spirosomataceae bacterium]